MSLSPEATEGALACSKSTVCHSWLVVRGGLREYTIGLTFREPEILPVELGCDEVLVINNIVEQKAGSRGLRTRVEPLSLLKDFHS